MRNKQVVSLVVASSLLLAGCSEETNKEVADSTEPKTEIQEKTVKDNQAVDEKSVKEEDKKSWYQFWKDSPEEKEQQELLENTEKLIATFKYDDALAEAKQAHKTYENRASKKMIKRIEKLIESDKAFATGLQLIEKANYIEAIDSFKKVSEEDGKNSKLAKEKVKEAESLHTQKLIKQAKDLYQKNDYVNAYETLETVSKFDKENKEAEKLLKSYSSKVVESYLQTAYSHFENGEYDFAQKQIDQAMDIEKTAEAYFLRGVVSFETVLEIDLPKYSERVEKLEEQSLFSQISMKAQLTELEMGTKEARVRLFNIKGKIKDSESDIQKAIELKPELGAVEIQDMLSVIRLMKDYVSLRSEYHDAADDMIDGMQKVLKYANDLEKAEQERDYEKIGKLNEKITKYMTQTEQDEARQQEAKYQIQQLEQEIMQTDFQMGI